MTAMPEYQQQQHRKGGRRSVKKVRRVAAKRHSTAKKGKSRRFSTDEASDIRCCEPASGCGFVDACMPFANGSVDSVTSSTASSPPSSAASSPSSPWLTTTKSKEVHFTAVSPSSSQAGESPQSRSPSVASTVGSTPRISSLVHDLEKEVHHLEHEVVEDVGVIFKGKNRYWPGRPEPVRKPFASRVSAAMANRRNKIIFWFHETFRFS